MSDDVDRFISTAPRLDFAFAIKATVGPRSCRAVRTGRSCGPTARSRF